MQTDVIDRTIVVDVMGEEAVDLLSRGGNWMVLASVSQAVYLINEREELIWLAAPAVPLHRRGLRVKGPIPRPLVGTEYRVKDATLMPDSDDEIHFSGSVIWKTPPPPEESLVSLFELSDLLLETYPHFLAWPKPACLAGLIPTILTLLTQRNHQGELKGVVDDLTDYWPSIRGLIRACFTFDFNWLVDNAARLVGLGPGLTPSGDDFLGGFFFGLHTLSRTYPNLSKIRDWNYFDFILDSKSRTHIISYTLLKDHAGGYAMEPLHAFVNGLLTGQPVDQNLQKALRLVNVGHSTGWDILTGFLAGMAVIYA